MTCPCAVCEKRFIGCHAECEVFRAWHEEQMERRRKLYERHSREDLLDDFKAKSVGKTKRRRKKK